MMFSSMPCFSWMHGWLFGVYKPLIYQFQENSLTLTVEKYVAIKSI